MRNPERQNQHPNRTIMTTPKNSSISMDRPKAKNLAIWMDHSNAHLMEFTTDPITTEIISKKPAHREKEGMRDISEDSLHHKEQHQQAEYYQKLCAIIRNFQDVLLFGPTGAKRELLNLLRSDHQFEHIKLDIKESDKMSQNKQHAFVRDHFSHR
jgi:hypothetical protein